MKQYNFLIILLIANMFLSCDKEIPFETISNNQIIVVDGIISNGPYDNYIQLQYSDSKLADSIYGYIYPKINPINNALVVVSDDMNNIDTLKRRYDYHDSIDNNGNYHFKDSTLNMDGYYNITKIKGKPGHTYFLYIKNGKNEYRASSYMQEVPIIDSLHFESIWNPVKNETYQAPLVSFKKINEQTHYYLFVSSFGNFSYCPVSKYDLSEGGVNRVLNMTIFSDTYLTPYVNGLSIGEGQAPDYWIKSYRWTFPGDTVKVSMFSISKESYNYYQSLFKQIDNDGGIFVPTPSTPVGNISNGALGIFTASAVSHIARNTPGENIYIKKNNIKETVYPE